MTESASRAANNDLYVPVSVQEGKTVAGKYVVGRTLGVGGMGMVYAARDTRLDRQVAIKVLLPRLVTSQTATQRFMREARAATRITSEHVVKLLEIDTLPDGTPLLVMEYLEGRDLRAVLREDGPLPPSVAVDYLLQALQAIAEGHMQTIVHRDLKPSNLFLTMRADGSPLIKVLDFGIAKTLEPEPSDTFALTGSEDVRLGSPTYMPPEQLQNPRDVDMRSDIWSLGVTLHELVCGSPPFQGLTYAELLSRILASPPEPLEPRLSELAIPDGLAEIVGKCLEKKREDRFSNAAELATALAPFGSDDARLSLYRVTGLSRVPASPRPASSGPITIVSDALASSALVSDSVVTCETTMPVPVAVALDAEPPPASGARRVISSPPPANRRPLLVFGSALALSATLLVMRHLPREPGIAQADSALGANIASSQPASAASAASSAPATQSFAQIPVQPPQALALPARSNFKPPHLKVVAPGAVSATPALAAHPPALPDSSAPVNNPPDTAGTLLIERLIEKRH